MKKKVYKVYGFETERDMRLGSSQLGYRIEAKSPEEAVKEGRTRNYSERPLFWTVVKEKKIIKMRFYPGTSFWIYE